MENFKKTIQSRIAVMSVFNGVAVVLIVLANTGVFPVAGGAGTADFIQGFLIGVLIGLELLFVYFMARYGVMLKNEELLRKQYVKENDERNRAIRDKIGGAGFQFLSLLFLAATVVSGFFNTVVFWTLLACTFAVSLIAITLKFYYKKKL